MSISAKKLNLGCGIDIMLDAINVDMPGRCEMIPGFRPEVDVAHDLNVLPWPWPANSFELIIAKAVLEHLRLNLMESLNECWRILKPGGLVSIKVPHWRSDISYQDVTHYWRFSLRSFDQFDVATKRGKIYAHYTPYKWAIVDQPMLNKAQSSIHFAMRKIV